MEMEADTRKDLRTLALFISIYCKHRHTDQEKVPVELKGFDMGAIAGKTPVLCGECRKLLTHAFVKRSHCPMHPKPACKHCQTNCYQPMYRQQIREVMKFSGRKLVLSGRLDLLFKLLF